MHGFLDPACVRSGEPPASSRVSMRPANELCGALSEGTCGLRILGGVLRSWLAVRCTRTAYALPHCAPLPRLPRRKVPGSLASPGRFGLQ